MEPSRSVRVCLVRHTNDEMIRLTAVPSVQTYIADPESPEAKLLIPYARGCLDAISLKHGPTHNEIIMTADG